jgi:hypothetical protein
MNEHDPMPGSDPMIDPDDGFDDELDGLDDDLADGHLGEHLRALLAPDQDLERHTTHHVDRTLRGRSVLGTGLDLLGLGWLTMRELLTDEPRRADGEGEGT